MIKDWLYNTKEWFYNNICEPVSKFYHKHILREFEQQDYTSTENVLNTQIDQDIVPSIDDSII